MHESRVKKAKRLLAGTELEPKENAGRYGFSHYQTFVRVFREHAGCGPREYRRRSRAQRASGG